MKPSLVTEQRVDKNGKLVTRHIKPATQKRAQALSSVPGIRMPSTSLAEMRLYVDKMKGKASRSDEAYINLIESHLDRGEVFEAEVFRIVTLDGLYTHPEFETISSIIRARKTLALGEHESAKEFAEKCEAHTIAIAHKFLRQDDYNHDDLVSHEIIRFIDDNHTALYEIFCIRAERFSVDTNMKEIMDFWEIKEALDTPSLSDGLL